MKKLIFIILIGILLLPQLKSSFNIFDENELNGVTEKTPKPVFNIHSWLEGDFQSQYNNFTEENIGFKNSLVRMYNQLNYSLFRIGHYKMIVGKKDYLFEGVYVEEEVGQNFVGEELISKNTQKIKIAQDYLDSRNIFLFTVLAPGKADFYREYIPNHFLKSYSGKRNYTTLLEQSAKAKIRLIDFNKWFLSIKDTSHYPLMTQYGIHWSYYGMAFCADSIKNYIEKNKNINLTKITWNVEESEKARSTDNDLEQLLNIFQPLPSQKLAYPQYHYSTTPNTVRPRLLVIADSFYWTIYNEQVFSHVFADETYYYYNSKISPSGRTISDYPFDLDIVKEVGKYDVILLLQSQGNYHNPGLGFTRMLLKALDRQKEYKEKAIKYINENKEMSSQAHELATINNITTDSAIAIIADSLVLSHAAEISKLKISMRGDAVWFKKLQAKSADENLSLEEVMQNDAEWVFEQNHKY